MTIQTKQRFAAYHEGGHALAAWLLGLPVHGIEIGDDSATALIVPHISDPEIEAQQLARIEREHPEEAPELRCHLIARVRGDAVLLFAGSCAEAWHRRKNLTDIMITAGCGDLGKLRRRAELLHWMTEQERLSLCLEQSDIAREIVQSHWQCIASLADSLCRLGRLTADEVTPHFEGIERASRSPYRSRP